MSRDLDLMRLHDEELSSEELAELEARLDGHDEAVLAGLDQLGDVVRALSDRSVADGIADEVMAKLDEPEPRAASVAKLEPVRRPPGRRPRTGPVVMAGIVLAAAAAGLLWLKATGETNTKPQAPVAVSVKPPPPPVVETSSPDPDPATQAADDDVAPAVAIEAVDFGNQAGTIFMVPAGDESTPVVWLEDEPTGARMEPL